MNSVNLRSFNELQELTRDNSPFRQGDDPYIPIRADVVKVFPPGCLTVDLKGFLLFYFLVVI